MPRRAFSHWVFLTLAAIGVLCRVAHAQTVETIVEHPSDRAIVFIHGLDGDPVASFTGRNGKTWAALMAQDDTSIEGQPALSSYDLYTVDYRQVFSAQMSLEGAAASISDAIVRSDVFQKHSFVWVIAHSMGGIITRRMTIDLLRKPLALDRLAGVLLFGVPSNGSPLAELGDGLSAGVLLQWFGTNGRLVADLKPIDANTYLESQSNAWADALVDRASNNRRVPRVYCAYETVPELSYGPVFAQKYATVVPRLYAEGHCSGRPTAFPLTHIQLVKPADVKDPVFIWARADIAESSRLLADEQTFIFEKGERLGFKLDYLAEQHGIRERSSGLPYVREAIDYASPQAADDPRRFYVRETATGPTAAAALENLAARSTCLRVTASPDRASLKLDFVRPPVSCLGSDFLACTPSDCPH